MATSYIAAGNQIQWTNGTGSDVSSGAVVVVGEYGLGVASIDIANGSTGTVNVCGIQELAKNTSDALSVGDQVWWDSSAGEAINVAAAGAYFLGYATKAATAAATTCQVKLATFQDDPGVRYIAGSATAATTLVAADFLTGSSEVAVTCANTTGVTLNLPNVADIPYGSKVTVLKTSADAAAITIDPADSEQIDGGSTFTSIDANTDYAEFVSNGTAWILTFSRIA